MSQQTETIDLGSSPASLALTEAQQQAVRDAVAEALGDAYDCTRVWGAWGCGTMSADDFSQVAEDDSRVAEIADAAISALRSAPPAPVSRAELTFAEGIEAAAKWIDQRREAHDNEFGALDPDTGTFEFRSVTQEEYSAELHELAEGIRELPTPHEGGSEPVEPQASSLVKFVTYLADHCEGQIINEEALQGWLADMLDDVTPLDTPSKQTTEQILVASAAPAPSASPAALTNAVDVTIKTIERQLELIAERAQLQNFLDKRPVVQSLQAHIKRLRAALTASQAEKKGESHGE